MDTPVWGQLPKAQDDAQTIAQAIDAAIAAHNDDPEAHLLTGQSIDVHRVNTMIDHPAGSIVPDKLTAKWMTSTTQFDSLDSWAHSTYVTTGFPGMNITVTEGDNVRAYCAGFSDGLQSVNLLSKEMLFQEIMSAYGFDSSTYIMFGMTLPSVSPTSAYTGVGFYFYRSGGVLYARVKSSTTTSDVVISGVDMTLIHSYRAHYVPDDNKIYFYVDGVQVASITKPSGSFTSGIGYQHWVQESGTGYEVGAHFYEIMQSFIL